VGKNKCIKSLVGKTEERSRLENVRMDGRIIFRWALKKEKKRR
jgi:hypothetical protein